MTNEEKQLSLKDFVARLPYRTRINVYNDSWEGCQKGEFDTELWYHHIEAFVCDRIEILPYLRPMSSITDGEKEELRKEHEKDEQLYAECIKKAKIGDNTMRGKVIPHFAADWCNVHHFDYRGLIEKGLAIVAPEEMYNN